MATSITKGTAGNAATVDTGDWENGQIFPADSGPQKCSTILIQVSAASAVPLKVSVTGVHGPETDGTGTYFQMAAGTEQAFRSGLDDITAVYVQGVGGTATFSWSVIAMGAR